MRKTAAVVLAVLVAFAFGTAAMAQDLMKVTGTVTQVDKAAKSVTIKPEQGEAVTVFMEDADALAKVTEGGKAEARYRVKDGKNVGTRLCKLAEGCS